MMKSSWSTGFKAARDASKNSNAHMISKRMGAALLNGRCVLSTGYNIFKKSHPEYRDIDDEGEDFCRNSHAELMALVRRKHHNVNNLTMYVYRELENGNPGCSKPCRFCMKLIRDFGVRKIRYYSEKGEYIEERLNL